MEAAQVDANNQMPADTVNMKVRLVFRLKSDLNMFRSVYQLEKSPLLHQILNPKSFPHSKATLNNVPFVYKGYVR